MAATFAHVRNGNTQKKIWEVWSGMSYNPVLSILPCALPCLHSHSGDDLPLTVKNQKSLPIPILQAWNCQGKASTLPLASIPNFHSLNSFTHLASSSSSSLFFPNLLYHHQLSFSLLVVSQVLYFAIGFRLSSFMPSIGYWVFLEFSVLVWCFSFRSRVLVMWLVCVCSDFTSGLLNNNAEMVGYWFVVVVVVIHIGLLIYRAMRAKGMLEKFVTQKMFINNFFFFHTSNCFVLPNVGFGHFALSKSLS